MEARKITIKYYFDGLPKLSDFDLIKETLPETLNEGGKSFINEIDSGSSLIRNFSHF